MLTNTPLLRYASHRILWHRRRNVRRALGAILLAVTFAALWWAWHATPGRWARFVYYQYRSEHYSASASTVVFAPAGTTGGWVLPTYRNSTPWTPLKAAMAWPSTTGAVTFLHDRQTPGGKHRLLAVELNPSCSLVFGGYIPMLMATTSVAAPSWGLPQPASQFRTLGVIHGKLKVFAGQPDAADPTHATIAYTLDDVPGQIDLRLRDDDTTDLAITSGPLAPGAVATTAASSANAIRTASLTRGETFGPAR